MNSQNTNMPDFTGRVAIVTGGARDIGRAVSLKFAKNGAAVAVNYYSSSDAAEETVSEIRDFGGRAIAVQADVTKAEEVEALVDETRSAFGEDIHLLVNNAGGLVARKRMHEMDDAFWDHVISLNLKSAFLVTKAVLEYMPDGGAIVNLSSLAARDGGGGGAIAYATAKGGIMTFSRGLAKELGPRCIRVNTVSPGLINTTFHDTFTPDEARKRVAGSCALGREGRAEEVADTVAYLASSEASYITGSSIEINGGLNFF
jgi:3-oxoacyl-[acyl-carrier protein] reductase